MHIPLLIWCGALVVSLLLHSIDNSAYQFILVLFHYFALALRISSLLATAPSTKKTSPSQNLITNLCSVTFFSLVVQLSYPPQILHLHEMRKSIYTLGCTRFGWTTLCGVITAYPWTLILKGPLYSVKDLASAHDGVRRRLPQSVIVQSQKEMKKIFLDWEEIVMFIQK